MASTRHIQAIQATGTPVSRKKSRVLQEDGVFTASGTSSEIPPDLVTAKEGDEESVVYWVLRNLYNFTIASCLYFLCCLKLKERAAKLTGDQTDGEDEALISPEINPEEARIKDKLRFHFMNPFQKWKYPARRRFPWKFMVQILGTILVTTQVALFAQSKFKLTYFLSQNVETFKVMFTRHECGTPKPMIITMEELYSQVNHTVYRYYGLRDEAVGPFDFDLADGDRRNLTMYLKEYEMAEVYAFNRSFNFNPRVKHRPITLYRENTTGCNTTTISTLSATCTNVSPPCCSLQCCNHTVQDQIQNFVNESTLDGIIDIHFEFGITSIYLDQKSTPVCTDFVITILLDNNQHTGSIPVSIEVQPKLKKCRNNLDTADVDLMTNSESEYIPLDVSVIVIVFLSCGTYIRSLIKSYLLAKETKLYFKVHLRKRLRWKELSPLYNKWFILMLFANVLIVIASMMKIFIGYRLVISLRMVDYCSILLGLGVFLQWCGLLRFLSYFESYNVLLITLQLAIPSVLRFAICTMIFYFAFLLCGWLVLGPYHSKFRNPYIASEALFSLLNGDDMYNTYEEMSTMSTPVWIFSKIYLYIFISLFIYVVLSLFIGLIGETYETLTELWRRRSHGYLRDWAEEEIIHTPTSDPPFPIPRVRAHSLSSDDHEEATRHHHHHYEDSRRHQSMSDLRPSTPILVKVEEPPSWNSPINLDDIDDNNKRKFHPLHTSANMNASNHYGTMSDEPHRLYPRLDSNSQLQELAASTHD